MATEETVLDSIIRGVREDLEERRKQRPLAEVRERAHAVAAARDALQALREATQDERGFALISEVKRTSPSKGHLAQIDDPAQLARAYERGGAAVVSVLTEARRFSGSLADLDAVRAAVELPVLRKDFTVDEYQIYEARAHGADLVLLIVAALTDEQLRDFLALTESLGMHALVETHTLEEIERAVAAGAKILGVNVRNLKTLDVDREVFARLAPTCQNAGTPIVVAESGVVDAQDIRFYAERGANAALVGEALVRGDRPEERVREFISAGARANAQVGTSH